MNIRHVAVVVIRVASIGWVFSTVSLLTYLPSSFARANLSATAHLSSASIVSAKAAVVNLFLHAAFALGLYVYAEPLAGFVTRDLAQDAEEPDRPAAL